MYNFDKILLNLDIILTKMVKFNENLDMNQQPRPKGTGYIVLIRYLYSGFNTFFKRPKVEL